MLFLCSAVVCDQRYWCRPLFGCCGQAAGQVSMRLGSRFQCSWPLLYSLAIETCRQTIPRDELQHGHLRILAIVKVERSFQDRKHSVQAGVQ